MGELTFYFDRCFGKGLPETLARAEPPFGIEYHHSKKNKFRESLEDDKWLEIAGTNGWIACSHDKKFHQIEVEKAAIRQHKVGCIYLWGGQLPTWDKVVFFAQNYNKIKNLVGNTKKPFLYHVRYENRIERVELGP